MNVTKDECDKIEFKISQLYKTTINELISQYEIYEHDLHPNIIESIVMLFQSLAMATNDNNEKKYELMKSVQSQLLIIMRDLYILLIKTYYKKIKMYRKFNQKFNQSGVFVIENGQELNFKITTENEYLSIKKELKKLKNKYNMAYKEINNNNTDNEELIEESDLSDLVFVYNKLRKLLDMHEKYRSDIVNNGYNGTLITKLWNKFYIFVSLILAALTLFSFLLNNYLN